MVAQNTQALFNEFMPLVNGDPHSAAMLVLASATLDPPEAQPFMALAQVATKLGVSDATIRNLVSSGKLPASRIGKGRGTLRFDPAEVTQFQVRSAGGNPAKGRVRRFVQ